MGDPIDNTKQKLFDAAVKVFAAKGYLNASVREICRLAGANVAAINYHYGSKEKLYAHVLDHIFRFPREKSMEYMPPLEDGTPEERLRYYIHRFLLEVYGCEELSAGYSDLSAIYLMEMARPSPSLDHIVENYIRPDSDELHGILTDLLGPDLPEDLQSMFGAFIAAMVLQYCHLQPVFERLEPGSPAPQTIIEPLTYMITEFTLGGMQRLVDQTREDSLEPHAPPTDRTAS